MKVMLDAGHGAYDNGAVYNDRKEKDDNLDIMLAVGDVLEQAGIEVLYTKTNDVYLSDYSKVRKANNEHVDLFLSFHRNYSKRPNESSGVISLVKEGDELGRKLAKDMNEALAMAGFKDLGVQIDKERELICKSNMSTILLFLGFINNDRENYLIDGKFDLVIESIAGVIYKVVTGKEMEFSSNVAEVNISSYDYKNTHKYYVQLGLFKNNKTAERLIDPLKVLGYPVSLEEFSGFFVIEVGDVDTLSQGKLLEADLKMFGYDTLLLSR